MKKNDVKNNAQSNNFIHKQIKLIVILLLMVFLGATYILLISKTKDLEKYDLTENVIVEHNGKKVFEGNILNYKVKNIKSEDSITMYMEVPNVDIVNASLKYDNINVAVDVYVDDKLIYSIGKNTPKVGVVCHAFNKVDLKNIKKDQEIKMCIRVLNASGFGALPHVFLMNTKDSDLEYFYDMMLYIIMAVYLFIIGIIGILIVSYNMNKDAINKRLTVLSITCIVCALYFVSLYQVIPLFSDNYLLDAYCEYIATIAVLVMLNLYMAMVNPRGKKLLSIILTVISSLFLIIVIMMQALRLRAFNDSMNIFLIICIVTAVNFLLTYGKNLKNALNKRMLILGSYIIVGMVVAYAVVYVFFNNYKEKVLIVVPIAIILVLTVEFIELVYEIIKGLISRAEKQALLNMAYIDRSTGLSNRRGLDQYVAKCVKDKYIVYLFDINGLKKINDQYGHAAGDDVIISFANQLKLVFGDGFCARIGGDEFVVVCEDNENKSLNNLKKNVDILNKESSKEYKLYYSVGWEEYKTNKDSIEDVIKKADSEMYKMKEKKSN